MDALALLDLVTKSDLLSAERKAVYIQVIPYLPQEASVKLAAIFAEEGVRIQAVKDEQGAKISELNKKHIEEMDRFVREQLKEAQARQEKLELDDAEKVLLRLDAL